MSQELLSSKVVIVEESPQVRGIPSFSTSVAGAVGITERGPIGEAVLCTSFPDFVRKFGGFTPDSDLALAAMGFFENGGTQLWVERTAHYSDPLDPASVTADYARGNVAESLVATPASVTGTRRAPFALDDDVAFDVSVQGGAPGEVAFTGVAAALRLVGGASFALTDGATLLMRIDSSSVVTVTFRADDFDSISEASRAEVLRVLAAQLPSVDVDEGTELATLTSRVRGTDSVLEVVGGTAATVLDFEVAQEGGGSVRNLGAVTAEEAQRAIAEAAPDTVAVILPDGRLELHTRATGAAATLQLEGTGAAAFGLDTELHEGSDTDDLRLLQITAKDPGTYGNALRLLVQPSPQVGATTFELRVFESGALRETWLDLSVDSAAARFAQTVINDRQAGSNLIRLVVFPEAAGRTMRRQEVALSGGEDGLVDLNDSDFVGNPVARSGLRALDRVQDLSIVLVPGQATPAVHQGMAQYCEVVREGLCFAVLDPPEAASSTGVVEYVDVTAGLGGLTEHAAMYWPRVQVLNPNRNVFGSEPRLTVAPSGIIAGVFARTDGARPGGVYDPPAGVDKGRLFGVLGFESNEVLEEPARDVVYPRRINPLTTQPGFPRYIDGSRTLKGDGNFPFVSERRGVAFISRSLKVGLQFAKHRANDERLRAEVRRTVTAFLIDQMNAGAFRSRDPETAFFVEVSDDPLLAFTGRLLVRVGLATSKPAEFVIVSLSQDTRALDSVLAA